jgi:hypothetical protein
MSKIGYFTNHCQFCDGGIEFAVNGVGEQIECPHCHQLITLSFPKESNDTPMRQIEMFLQASPFPTTKAELDFLGEFYYPQEVKPSPRLQMWDGILNADPLLIVEKFLDESLVQKTDLDLIKQLQFRSSNELKAMAKDRGVGHSGTKETIAARLVKSDPEGIAQLFCDNVYFVCSPKGRILVEKFKEARANAKECAQNESFAALKQGRIGDSCLAVANYKASLNSNNSLDVSSQERDFEILRIISSTQLSRHANFDDEAVSNLRIGAAMMQIWGEYNPRPWLDGEDDRIDLVAESRAILFYALENVRREDMKRAGIRRVKILLSGNGDDCSICCADKDKIYSIDNAPILPHEGCSCDGGCKCITIAVAT